MDKDLEKALLKGKKPKDQAVNKALEKVKEVVREARRDSRGEWEAAARQQLVDDALGLEVHAVLEGHRLVDGRVEGAWQRHDVRAPLERRRHADGAVRRQRPNPRRNVPLRRRGGSSCRAGMR